MCNLFEIHALQKNLAAALALYGGVSYKPELF